MFNRRCGMQQGLMCYAAVGDQGQGFRAQQGRASACTKCRGCVSSWWVVQLSTVRCQHKRCRGSCMDVSD
jgi:hypothetical protein